MIPFQKPVKYKPRCWQFLSERLLGFNSGAFCRTVRSNRVVHYIWSQDLLKHFVSVSYEWFITIFVYAYLTYPYNMIKIFVWSCYVLTKRPYGTTADENQTPVVNKPLPHFNFVVSNPTINRHKRLIDAILI